LAGRYKRRAIVADESHHGGSAIGGDGMDQAIELLQEIARDDLEKCEAAIRAEDKVAAIEAIERAFAKLDTAIDVLRSMPSG
jgi:hypothetical protein